MVNATKGEDLYAEAQGRAIQEQVSILYASGEIEITDIYYQRRSLFRKNNKTVKFKEVCMIPNLM